MHMDEMKDSLISAANRKYSRVWLRRAVDVIYILVCRGD